MLRCYYYVAGAGCCCCLYFVNVTLFEKKHIYRSTMWLVMCVTCWHRIIIIRISIHDLMRTFVCTCSFACFFFFFFHFYSSSLKLLLTSMVFSLFLELRAKASLLVFFDFHYLPLPPQSSLIHIHFVRHSPNRPKTKKVVVFFRK